MRSEIAGYHPFSIFPPTSELPEIETRRLLESNHVGTHQGNRERSATSRVARLTNGSLLTHRSILSLPRITGKMTTHNHHLRQFRYKFSICFCNDPPKKNNSLQRNPLHQKELPFFPSLGSNEFRTPARRVSQGKNLPDFLRSSLTD